MPRASNGVYTLPNTVNPVVTNTTITSNWANTTLADIEAVLTSCLDRAGRGAMQANLQMGGFKVTGAADGTAGTDLVTKGQMDAVSVVVATKLDASAVSAFGLDLIDSADAAAARSALDVPTRTGGGASGVWPISISGNAATVTNGVTTVGDQIIAGDKTFTGVTTFSSDRVYQTGSGIGFEMGPGVRTGDANKQGFSVPAGKSLYLAGNGGLASMELGPSGVIFTGLTLSTSVVNAATAGSSVGGIGTYAYLYINRAISPGGTASSSELLYAGEGGSNTPGVAGTWRAMGVRGAGGNTMFLRIA